MERIWGLLNTHAAEVYKTVSKISKKNKAIAIGGLPDMSWKATAALQFSTKLKDIKRLKKMNKEFEHFVSVGTDKRYIYNNVDYTTCIHIHALCTCTCI